MTDQQLALQAVRAAQRIVEEYLEPRPHDNERLLDRLVEVFEQPSIVGAVNRLQRKHASEFGLRKDVAHETLR